MESRTDNIEDFKCPLCNNILAKNDYHSALSKMEAQAKLEADKKIEADASANQQRLDNMKKEHGEALAKVQSDYAELNEQRKKELSDYLDTIKRDSASNKEDLEKRHQEELDSQAKRTEEQLAALKREIEAEYSGKLDDKEKENDKLQNIIKNTEDKVRGEINDQLEQQRNNHEKELDYQKSLTKQQEERLARTSQELDAMKRKMEQGPSELVGEVGEHDLRRLLEAAFPDDRFDIPNRGEFSADLIQHIKLPSGEFDMPIVYDNKAGSYTKKDIEKSIEYKKTHGTSYSFIVTTNPQKKSIPNGLLGETSGVIVVHPSIVVQVAKTIRGAILDIARMSVSQKDRDAKQARLYKYVVGNEFTDVMKLLETADREMDELQTKEEKAHSILWKNRKSVLAKQRKAHIDLTCGIEAIIHKDEGILGNLAPAAPQEILKN